ncbi:hypothetical protein OIDMADRAFT_61208 [Oidiodendron maius Zn]|uniref:FAS1 domain-containing protein n=1 Tax=Oidiodendron maius (strain Zn) TaxID=913774 RepID=A0A0C3GRF9_OIDMZ|nr:hypothetical protein OIDMADRAFT_61208 [Oidiodendron maius Zn]
MRSQSALIGSIALAAIASGSSTSATSTSTSSSITTAGLLPTLSPPNGPVSAPADSTLIQIGFLGPLNYQFIIANPVSSAQIFMWLPEGLAHGLGLNSDQVVMESLAPLNTTARLHYITTLALAYIPTNMVSSLALDLHNTTATLYNDPDSSVKTLMNLINPSIPLAPGSNLPDTDSTGTGSAGAASSTAAT